MKCRLSRVALLVGALSILACSSQTAAPPASLEGAYDLARVGDLLFVTSTDASELRALDLSADPQDFVRAPNPLEPLSIPVLSRPVGLVADAHWVDGAQVFGPYLYVRGAGAQAISIVGASRDQLTELLRLTTSGTVTALAGLGPSAEGDPSTLYYATWDGSRGTLWTVSVPPADQLAKTTLSPTPIVTNPGESIRALLLMPDGKSLVVATRDAAGSGGRTVLLDLDTLGTRDLDFGAPVRMLRTNPKEGALAAGSRIFGVLDETACGGGPTCTGILAVDTASGARSIDTTGHPMVPLTFGRGLIRGFTLQASGKVVDPRVGVATLVLLGVVTTSGDSDRYGGSLYFFDGDGLRQIDIDDAPASVVSTTYLDPSGAALDYVAGPQNVTVADGAMPSEVVSVTYQGYLPGLVGRASDEAAGQTFSPPSSLLPEVQVGDFVHLQGPDPACAAELPVSAVSASALTTSGTIPAECADWNAYSVHAGATRPYVVTGGTNAAWPNGYMGRTSNGSSFEFAGRYFYHPRGVNLGAPQIRFEMGPGDPSIQRGSSYRILTNGHYAPLYVTVDTGFFPAWYLPGSVVYYQKPDQGIEQLFVAYPSAQGILELIPGTLVPNVPNSANLVVFQ